MKRKILVCLLATLTVLLCLVVTSMAGAPTDKMVISTSTTWKYLDTNTDPAAGLSSLDAWTKPGYNDSSWKSGKGPFGYNYDEAANTTLNFYKSGSSGDVIPTYFFRTTFNLTNAEEYNKIIIRATIDDSFAVYINGTKIADTRTSTNSSTNLFYSGGEKYYYISYCFREGEGLLKNGENTVAVQLHNDRKSSSDIFMNLYDMTIAYEDIPDKALVEQRVMTPGRDETERNLAWFSTASTPGEVRVVDASYVVNGAFPSSGYAAFSVKSVAEKVYSGIKYVKKATISGLEENTRYAYVYAVGGEMSDIYYFNVGSFGDFDFVYISDPQLQEPEDAPLWHSSLDRIVNGLGAELLVCAGDQVSTMDNLSLYQGFITEELSGITFAPSVGPGHESPSILYQEHYNLPNLSTDYGVSNPSANYHYVYNNVLFIHLNSADKTAYTNGEHAEYVEKTMKANPDADWTIVVMHYSFFTTGKYADNGDMIGYRNKLAPKLTELGVDLVLSGHDHIYTRTHLMNGTTVAENVDIVGNTIHEPDGTLYVVAGSSTGTKYYEKTGGDKDYAAKERYKTKNAVKISVTETTLTITAYDLTSLSPFDTVTLDKNPHSCSLELIKGKAATCIAQGKREYFACECGVAYEDAAGLIPIENTA
ncbi:MAG: metallophosphoesterase family protein, partial [Clostridia bacterium]|nr:metallophosphoesterase family protein [Clostridia bacterium]